MGSHTTWILFALHVPYSEFCKDGLIMVSQPKHAVKIKWNKFMLYFLTEMRENFVLLLSLLLLNLRFILLKICFYIFHHIHTQFSQLYSSNGPRFYCIFLQLYYVYNALYMPCYFPWQTFRTFTFVLLESMWQWAVRLFFFLQFPFCTFQLCVESVESYHAYVPSSKRTLGNARGSLLVTDYNGHTIWAG